MCDCLDEVPKAIKQKLVQRGYDVVDLPEIETKSCFSGDFEYFAVALYSTTTYNHKKRDGSVIVKKEKRPLIPRFCPFCGERYIKQ